MKDFFGKELHVGDKVVYSNTSAHQIFTRRGVVKELGAQGRFNYAIARGEDTHRDTLIYESVDGRWSATNIIKMDWQSVNKGVLDINLCRDIAIKAMSDVIDAIYDSGFDPSIDWKDRFKAYYDDMIDIAKRMTT